MKLLVAALFLILSPFALAITKYEQCRGNGGGAVPDKLFIRDCEEAPCDFYNGDLMMAVGDFVAEYDTTNLTAQVDAYKFGIRIEFDLPPEALDACKDLQKGSCPVKRGDELVYGFEEVVEGIPITTTVVIEFALRDDAGRNFICARFDGKVYRGPRGSPTEPPTEPPTDEI